MPESEIAKQMKQLITEIDKVLRGAKKLQEDAKKIRSTIEKLKPVKEWCSIDKPCCNRRNEYNGFGAGPLKFICPEGCRCHDEP